MKLDNVKKVMGGLTDWDYVVCDGSSGRRIYCDGRIMVANTELEIWEAGTSRQSKMVTACHELWVKVESDAPSLVVVSDGGLFGSFLSHYIRKFLGTASCIWINEKFIRCFDADAEFRGRAGDKAVCVFENGLMVGIIMPTAPDREGEPPSVPFLEDAVLYHECEVEEHL